MRSLEPILQLPQELLHSMDHRLESSVGPAQTGIEQLIHLLPATGHERIGLMVCRGDGRSLDRAEFFLMSLDLRQRLLVQGRQFVLQPLQFTHGFLPHRRQRLAMRSHGRIRFTDLGEKGVDHSLHLLDLAYFILDLRRSKLGAFSHLRKLPQYLMIIVQYPLQLGEIVGMSLDIGELAIDEGKKLPGVPLLLRHTFLGFGGPLLKLIPGLAHFRLALVDTALDHLKTSILLILRAQNEHDGQRHQKQNDRYDDRKTA